MPPRKKQEPQQTGLALRGQLPSLARILDSDTLAYSQYLLDPGARQIKRLGIEVQATRSPQPELHRIPSYFLELDELDDARPGPDTVVISVNNQKIMIGAGAKALGGSPIHRTHKHEIYLWMFLASLPTNAPDYIEIEEIRMLVTDTRLTAVQETVRSCLGRKYVELNGRPVTVNVDRILVCNETEGAFWLFKSSNMLPGVGVTPIISIGGSDGFARIFGSGGEIARQVEIKIQGTVEIANYISRRIQQQVNITPNEADIMDAIEQGDCIYRFQSYEINFADMVVPAIEAYSKKIEGQLKIKWADYWPQMYCGFFVGGSAPLMQHAPFFQKMIANGLWKIPSSDSFSDLHRYADLFGLSSVPEQNFLEIHAS